eukprot:SAG11_NODE_4949_length_1712_cov_0.789213_3_plen_224_part_00
MKVKNYGLPGETRRRWCGRCAKNHGGEKKTGENRNARVEKKRPWTPYCEDCEVKARNYGLPDVVSRRWCGGCAKKYGGVKKGIQPTAVKKAPKARKRESKLGVITRKVPVQRAQVANDPAPAISISSPKKAPKRRRKESKLGVRLKRQSVSCDMSKRAMATRGKTRVDTQPSEGQSSSPSSSDFVVGSAHSALMVILDSLATKKRRGRTIGGEAAARKGVFTI